MDADSLAEATGRPSLAQLTMDANMTLTTLRTTAVYVRWHASVSVMLAIGSAHGWNSHGEGAPNKMNTVLETSDHGVINWRKAARIARSLLPPERDCCIRVLLLD